MKLINKQIVSLPSEDNKFTYIVRYTPWFTDKVMINVIYGDFGVLHSHPWSYFTFILWGGYKETLIENDRLVIKNRYPGWFTYRNYSVYHKADPLGKLCITFFVRGKEQKKYVKFMIDGKEIRDIKHWKNIGCTKEQINNSIIIK
jgi:hypothetical protein